MSLTDHYFRIAASAIRALTWSRIFKVGMLSAISILLVSLWIFRATLITSSLARNEDLPTLRVSHNLKDELGDVVKRSESIIGIQITTVNFQRNILLDTYSYFDNDQMQINYKAYIKNKITDLPLFNEDKANNQHVIRLINGEFICSPFSQSGMYRYSSNYGTSEVYMCEMGIPPFYGQFSGILTLYVSGKPSKDTLEQMLLLSRELSLRVYDENKGSDQESKLRDEFTGKR